MYDCGYGVIAPNVLDGISLDFLNEYPDDERVLDNPDDAEQPEGIDPIDIPVDIIDQE